MKLEFLKDYVKMKLELLKDYAEKINFRIAVPAVLLVLFLIMGVFSCSQDQKNNPNFVMPATAEQPAGPLPVLDQNQIVRSGPTPDYSFHQIKNTLPPPPPEARKREVTD